jgi:hypothetical protein
LTAAAVRCLAVCFGVVLGLSGCGGDEAPVATAGDTARSERITELEREVKRLGEKRRDEAQREDTAESGKQREPGVSRASSAASLDALAARLSGRVGLAITPVDRFAPIIGGEHFSDAAWSTIKVPIAHRFLQEAGGPEQISNADRDLIRRALQQSDNDAAAALFESLKREHGGLEGASAAVGEMLPGQGTEISTVGRDGFSTYGQTEWALADQLSYMSALAAKGQEGDPVATYLLEVMSEVGGSDTFGLGSISARSRWKGGWGPGVDGRYLVRQMGLVQLANAEYAVAMMAVADDGSFETGRALLDEMASWLMSQDASSLTP